MKSKKTLLLLTFSFISLACFTQNRNLDSLLIALKIAKEDTIKVNTLIDLSKQLTNKGDYKQAKKLADHAFTLAQQLNFIKGIASAHHNIGNIYFDQGNYTEAIKSYFASLKIRKEIVVAHPDDFGNKKAIAACYNNLGRIYSDQSNYPNALKSFFYSLKIKEEIDDKKGIGNSYNCIGIVFEHQGNYPEALKHYFSSLKIFEAIGVANPDDFVNKKAIANCYKNIGNVYYRQNNYAEALKNQLLSLKIQEEIALVHPDDFLNKKGIADSYVNIGNVYSDQKNYYEASKKNFAALKVYEEIGVANPNDFGNKKGIANTYNNIGNIYADQGNYTEALKNQLLSFKIKEEIGDREGMTTSYLNLGSINIKLKKVVAAKKHLDNALALSLEIGSKDNIKLVYDRLSTIDSVQGNWKAAYEHHKLFIIYRDSIDNEETQKKTIQAGMKYEFEKKEALTKAEQDKKDAMAATEMKKQQIIRYAVSGTLALVLLFTFFLYNRFRLIRKQKNIIELKEKETQQQKHIIEEKHKEITDSINYAERIQRSFLATTKMLDKNLKDYFVFFKPKDVVSGDFYWAGELNNGNFAFCCADSTGHGVPGAIMSILNISSLEKSIEQEVEPNEILNKTRKIIIERLKKDGSAEGGKDGMDCSLLVINKARTHLTFAAANNPVFIVRQRHYEKRSDILISEIASRSLVVRKDAFELIEFKPDKMPVGKHDKDFESFNIQTATLQQGDLIYTLTDGFPDQFGGEKGKKYMIKKLKELLLQIAPLTMPEQEQKLAQEFISWKGDNEQVDDVCVIGIKI